MKKSLWFLMAVLGVVVFVGGPLFVQYTHWPQGSNGNGDWLSFWGSYLGIIPSGLIAYFVAKYQIVQQDLKNIENEKSSLLPYFNIEQLLHGKETIFRGKVSFNFIVSTKESNLPIINVNIKTYLKSTNQQHLSELKNTIYGHVFPNKINAVAISTDDIDIDPDVYIIDRIDIQADLIDGRKVFFTWGDGNNGTHIVELKKDKWEAYTEKNKLSEALSRKKKFEAL